MSRNVYSSWSVGLHVVTIYLVDTGFGLIIGFIERLQLVTTNSYNTFLTYTLQITTANTKSSMSSLVVAW
jgi:hypothetical protein